MAQYKPGWYDDPYAAKGSGTQRWYDGTSWTAQVSQQQGGATTRAPARPRAAARPAAPAVHHHGGATWESIPQPGTTFTQNGLNRPALRVRILPVLLLLAAAVAIVIVLARASR